ncbi:MAG: hypothetical protein HKN94_13495 [Acidimicrobiales bacterium]|nr:hypothetical protein [Acidimicrobiales bacterium]RZV45928.1 MAG: hypothetical protein EX269_08600 [Acidimicrobiales bacterium]
MRIGASLRRRRDDDRGVAAAMMTIALVALLGMSALVVDVGNAWQARRHVITSTDAAALAAAKDYVQGNNGCAPGGTAEDYVVRNNADATMTNCTSVALNATTPGRVTVDAEVDVDYIFAPILGLTGTTVKSSTTASWALAGSVSSDLRPFGQCADLLDSSWIGDGSTHKIFYSKDTHPTACNGYLNVPGNWGVVDFNFGSPSAQETRTWTEFGYTGPPPVEIGKWYPSGPGAPAPGILEQKLKALKDDMTIFPLPVFDDCRNCAGNLLEYHLSGFVAVRIEDFDLNPPKGDEFRFLELEFYDLEILQGGGGGTVDLGTYVIGICAIDNTDVAANCG